MQKYDYKIVMLTPPELQPNGLPAGNMPQLPHDASGYEISDVSVVNANIRQNPNDPNPPKTRDVLIYTLRKPLQ